MEQLLLEWFHDLQHNLPISDDILKQKAREIGNMIGLEGFKYLNGWVAGLKSRNGIKSRKLHGEGRSHNFEATKEGLNFLTEQLREYELEDIYNIDETALSYRLEPDKTLATQEIKGVKQCKERITVVLCCNSNGTDKLKPLVIGKYEKPRCFKGFDKNQFVQYFNNKNAWMTKTIFVEFLENFDKELMKRNRNIVLLMDHCSAHIVDIRLQRIKIIFFPPCTTSIIQPLDCGIIRNFKLNYRYQLVQNYLA